MNQSSKRGLALLKTKNQICNSSVNIKEMESYDDTRFIDAKLSFCHELHLLPTDATKSVYLIRYRRRQSRVHVIKVAPADGDWSLADNVTLLTTNSTATNKEKQARLL